MPERPAPPHSPPPPNVPLPLRSAEKETQCTCREIPLNHQRPPDYLRRMQTSHPQRRKALFYPSTQTAYCTETHCGIKQAADLEGHRHDEDDY